MSVKLITLTHHRHHNDSTFFYVLDVLLKISNLRCFYVRLEQSCSC